MLRKPEESEIGDEQYRPKYFADPDIWHIGRGREKGKKKEKNEHVIKDAHASFCAKDCNE